MRNFIPSGLLHLSILTMAVMTSAASGQTRSQVYGGTLTQQTQTAFFAADVGFQTYESESVESKDTSPAYNYRVGGFAGEDRVLGVFANIADSTTPFELNESRIRTAWRDLAIQYRLGFLYPTVYATSSELTLTAEGVEDIHIFGTGFGAGLAVQVPITKQIIVQADAKSINTASAHDRYGAEVDVGRRDEAELSASVDLVERYVDLIVGYRYRNYDLTIEDTKSVETQTTPFGGLRLGLYF